MALRKVTFRLSEDKLQALDSAAHVQERDRSFVINEAVTQYLSLQDYHRMLIEDGIKQADAGMLIEHDQVLAMAAEWVTKSKNLT